jgi:hypothetical protein
MINKLEREAAGAGLLQIFPFRGLSQGRTENNSGPV